MKSKASFNRSPAARLYFQLIRETKSLCFTSSKYWGQIRCMWNRKDWSSVVGQHRTKLLGQPGGAGSRGPHLSSAPWASPFTPVDLSLPPVTEGRGQGHAGNLTKQRTMAGPQSGATKSEPEGPWRLKAAPTHGSDEHPRCEYWIGPSLWILNWGAASLTWGADPKLCGILGTTPGPSG